jgi:hypothetical protein
VITDYSKFCDEPQARLTEHPALESAQFVCGCCEVGQGAGEGAHVAVEHLAVDIVDCVASLVVAPVIDLAGLSDPPLGEATMSTLRYSLMF